MQLDEQLHHGQTESGAFESSGEAAVDLTEGLKEPLQRVPGNPDAAVGDADAEKFRELAVGKGEASSRPGAGELADVGAQNAAGAQGHLATLGGEFHRVGQ